MCNKLCCIYKVYTVVLIHLPQKQHFHSSFERTTVSLLFILIKIHLVPLFADKWALCWVLPLKTTNALKTRLLSRNK